MDARLAAAVADNAQWCHLVCSTHGITGRFDDDAWVSSQRTPPMYPDAVTLTDQVSTDALLSRIDRTAGSSIKDSFMTLDLTAEGFKVVFVAQWLWRSTAPAKVRGGSAWERVERPEALLAWSRVHGGGRTFSPALLDEPSVTILGRRDGRGRFVAGAIATDLGLAVGISNVFAVGVDGDEPADATAAFAEAFAGATAQVVERFPDRPMVGYELGDDLAAARTAGFEEIGPLRVWLLGSERP